MKASILAASLLVVLVSLQVDQAAGTVALTEVTGLVAAKVLGLAAIGLLQRRGKRSVHTNEVEDMMRLVGAEEPEECYQLLYCHLADTGAAVPDQQAEALRRVVTAQPGRHQAAHLAGKAGKVCEARYKCRIQAEDIVQFYLAYNEN